MLTQKSIDLLIDLAENKLSTLEVADYRDGRVKADLAFAVKELKELQAKRQIPEIAA